MHFVTSKTHENIPFFSNNLCCEILLADIRFYQDRLGFVTVAWVIMPDHFHALFWWDRDENPRLDISTVMQRIKSHSSKEIYRQLRALDRFPHVGTKVWQDRFYDFVIWDQRKTEEKIAYIHMNPVRKGLVELPEDYRWSSYREFLERE